MDPLSLNRPNWKSLYESLQIGNSDYFTDVRIIPVVVDRLGHRVSRLGGQREELRRGHGGGGGVGGGAEVAALLEEGADGLDVGALARGVHRVVQVHPLQVRHRRRYLEDIKSINSIIL